MLPEFSNVVHILEVILATMCSAERSFNALRRLKTDQRSTMGQQCVSNIEPINIESAYANSVVNNVMDRITDTSSAIGMAETAISFKVFCELYDRFTYKTIFTSYVNCRPILVHLMTLVCFRMFRKKLN